MVPWKHTHPDQTPLGRRIGRIHAHKAATVSLPTQTTTTAAKPKRFAAAVKPPRKQPRYFYAGRETALTNSTLDLPRGSLRADSDLATSVIPTGIGTLRFASSDGCHEVAGTGSDFPRLVSSCRKRPTLPKIAAPLPTCPAENAYARRGRANRTSPPASVRFKPPPPEAATRPKHRNKVLSGRTRTGAQRAKVIAGRQYKPVCSLSVRNGFSATGLYNRTVPNTTNKAAAPKLNYRSTRAKLRTTTATTEPTRLTTTVTEAIPTYSQKIRWLPSLDCTSNHIPGI